MSRLNDLPTAWVDAIFARLSLAYGARFREQWEGLQPEHVKAAWKAELRGVTADGIAYALAHLNPDFPPNAMQFVALCRNQPPSVATLPRPKADPEVQARAIAALNALGKPKTDPKAWALKLKQREESGEHLSSFQRWAWREAL